MGNIIQLHPGKSNETISKLHQQFNKQIRFIHSAQKEIKQLRDQIRKANVRIDNEVKPLDDKLVEIKVRIVHLFDETYQGNLFNKRQKRWLARVIEYFSFTLITDEGRKDLEPIHDKYSDTPIEEINKERNMAAGDMLSDMFGFDIDAEGLDLWNMEESLGKIKEQVENKMEEREQKQQKRKKTKAQIAREERIKADAESITKLVKGIYFKLAKELHPDLEQDEHMKDWKTKAMQRVTKAYQENDFYSLLNLQIEFNQLNGKALSELDNAQLKYYLDVLKDQSNALKEELHFIKNNPMTQFIYQNFCGEPKMVEKRMYSYIFTKKESLDQAESDLARMTTSSSFLRDFIITFPLPEQDGDEDDREFERLFK
jgi:hypothetical protein